MKTTSSLMENISNIRNILEVNTSFDIIERVLKFANKTCYMYYIDGFIKDDIMQFIMREFFNLSEEKMKNLNTPIQFIQNAIPYVEVDKKDDMDAIALAVLSGQTAIFIDGFESSILLDLRTYPARGPEEPEKEKSLRGSRDGFVETIVFNTAMIRRRIRDPRLVFEMNSIGSVSKTDVVIGYIKGSANEKALKIIRDKISSLKIDSLTLGNQSLVEAIVHSNWYNPFPKARYSERPDVAAAHIMEGKIIIIVDNSPSAIILPTSLFDFLQDVDDYYLPICTGQLLRFSRNLILLLTLIITPLYLLLIKNPHNIPAYLTFLLPKESYAIPVFLQFILLEFAVDGLKLASLNTPSSLGTSLSVIAALIMGDLAITSGWFIPQCILYMSIVALGGFTQPSVELSYAIKFLRIILLICTASFNLIGFIIGIAICIFLVATNKTFTGEPYLYPLIPFNWNSLKHLLFRTRLQKKQNEK